MNGAVTQYTYGTSNNTAQGWYDLGNLTQVVQDPGSGHLNRTTTMHYDAMGRVIQSTDPSGLTSTFTYNTLGQPLSVVTPARGSIPGETISYAYDANGRTHSETDNRGSTVMAYEQGSDRVSTVTDPVTGTTGYTYGLLGQRLTLTLPGGGTWTYNYITSIGGSVGEHCLVSDDPDKMSVRLGYITDDQGRRVDFTLDQHGLMRSAKTDEVFTTGGSLVAYLETDDTYDVGTSVTASHFWLSQVATSWHWLSGNVWYSRLVSSNGYTYDTLGQRLTNLVTQMTPGSGGAPQYTGGTPTYDGSGNVTNEVTNARTETYTYDDLSRLSTVNYGDGQTQSYTFDAMGNRVQRVDSAAGTTGYTVDAANRLTASTGAGASTYTNDADGNTLTGGGRTNTWDSQNRMVSCSITGSSNTFKYGADGLRRQKTTNSVTTDYAYDGQMLVREGHASGGTLTATITYFQGASGPCYRRDDTQTEQDSQGRTVTKARWYVYDGLGSVLGEVDPLGDLTSNPKYDVYGAVRANGGTATSKQGFVGSLGHLSEPETGLIYMRARYMDPTTGRFENEDYKRDGNNWFALCENNPINKIDVTGKADISIDDILNLSVNERLQLANRLEDAAFDCFERAHMDGEAAASFTAAAARCDVAAEAGEAITVMGMDISGDMLMGSAINFDMQARNALTSEMNESFRGEMYQQLAMLLRMDTD